MFRKPNVKILWFNVIFLTFGLMLFLYCRILFYLFPRLELFGCGAIFVLKRHITKMAPQGVLNINYDLPKLATQSKSLSVPLSCTTNSENKIASVFYN